MRIVIHQPYFLAWLGYFAKLRYADAYVALDDANFRKRHFQDRSQVISMHGQPMWIGVPTGQNFGLQMRQVVVPEGRWAADIDRTIRHSYSKARFVAEEWPVIASALLSRPIGTTLAELNLGLTGLLAKRINGRDVPIFRSSQLGSYDDATSRIIEICRSMKADGIIVGSGASINPAVHDIKRIRDAKVRIWVQDFFGADIQYFQTRRRQAGFVAGLSAVDALVNEGADHIGRALKRNDLNPTELVT